MSYFVLHYNIMCIFVPSNQNNMTKEDVIQIRVEPQVKAKLQAMADKDNRKLSDFVRLLILNAIKKK